MPLPTWRSLVVQLASQLRIFDHEAYLFEHDVQPGKLVTDKVQEQINKCGLFVVSLTKEGYNSPYVQQEIGYALHAHKSIVPLVEPGVPDSALAMLQGLEYVKLDLDHPDEVLSNVASYAYRLGREQQMKLDTTIAVAAIMALIIGIYLLSKTKGVM
jgi:hypothetical protein